MFYSRRSVPLQRVLCYDITMKFSSSYEPGEYESDIYAAWEASGIFKPTLPTVPTDDDGDGVDDRTDKRNTYSIVMPPPNANGNLHIGHGLTIALEDSLTRYYRLKGKSTWYVPGADHAGFETWVVYERNLEAKGHTRFEFDRNELYARVWDFVAEQRGNMELQLDRNLSNKRIFPAVDVVASSTRREDLLLSKEVMQRSWFLRRYLSEMTPIEAMEFLEKQMSLTRSNEEFLATMNQ